jgi:predicted O-methyltransferase YrrM
MLPRLYAAPGLAVTLILLCGLPSPPTAALAAAPADQVPPQGRLVTIEFDPVRAKEAAANVQRAGLSDIVQVIAGDAFKEIPRVQGPFDLVFLDAWKPDYKKVFDLVFPRLTPGGLFLAHNVIKNKNDMLDFLTAIQTHPQALTTTVSPGHEGISVTYKRRQ